MAERESTLYWWPGNNRKEAVLLFDPGYSQDEAMMGSVYIYELKEEHARADLTEELKKRGTPAMTWKLGRGW